MIISRRTSVLPFLLTIVTLLTSATAFAADKRTSREDYIERYKHIAIEHQRIYGIPASITMAQGILESDSGNSTLARGSNNHFGIKCKSNWTGKTFTHTDDAPDECFRAYKSVEDSYEDHAKFLDESPRYDSLFDFRSDDYHSWARGLKSAGYATAPDYTARLVKIIEDLKLYLLDSSDGMRQYTAMVNAARADLTSGAPGHMNPNRLSVSLYRHGGYSIYEANQSQYIVSERDDTYSTLASTFKVSAARLRRFNDMESGSQHIDEGSVIYIERKAKKWYGKESSHKVERGETIHSISQLYGVREARLRRMNKLKEGEEVIAGAIISLK